MLEKWARQSAGFLVARSSRPVVPEVIAYGMQIVYEHLVELFVWIVLGFLINDWLMWSGVLLGLLLTRQAMGGVHAKRFSRCLIITIASLSCGYFLCQIIHYFSVDFDQTQNIHELFRSFHYPLFWLYAGYLLIGFAMITWVVPVRWGERPYSKSRIWKHRMSSALVFISICLAAIPAQTFSIAMLTGSILVMCLSTPTMQRWIAKS